MTEYMTSNEYEAFIELQTKFNNCVKQCAIEISQIIFNREPIGEFCADFELYENDKYMVQFEEWDSCERGYDTIFVPIMYLHNEGYRKYYNKYLGDQKIARETARKSMEEEAKKNVRIVQF